MPKLNPREMLPKSYGMVVKASPFIWSEGTCLRFYKIAEDRRLFLSTASGVLTLADVLAHQDQILAEPDFNPQFSQLMDFTHVTKIDLSAEDICRLAERDIFHPTSSRAILVTNDLGEGLARLFAILREHAAEKRIRIFRNLDEALKWVFIMNVGK
jgi:hypothetical protein